MIIMTKVLREKTLVNNRIHVKFRGNLLLTYMILPYIKNKEAIVCVTIEISRKYFHESAKTSSFLP